MDNTLQRLCESLQTIIAELRQPHATPLSFLLLTGKKDQGKTELLKQSSLTPFPMEETIPANIYYNQKGIVLELSEEWLLSSENLLAYSLQQLNRCHAAVKISGIILCIDSHELLCISPSLLLEHCKNHVHLLQRYQEALESKVDVALLFTKLDHLAGFCEFFQAEHSQDRSKPLGFSMELCQERNVFIKHYRQQFDTMIEALSAKMIDKLHPARSSQKRTLILEFPFQFASLRTPIQNIMQQLHGNGALLGLYFTSARQGGLGIDKLSEKVAQEYALTIPHALPACTNYKAYFIEGALHVIQENTLRYPIKPGIMKKLLISSTAIGALLLLCAIGYHYFFTSTLLDQANQELLAYDLVSQEKKDPTSALYHLSKAEKVLARAPTSLLPHPMLDTLKTQLTATSSHQLQTSYMPTVLHILEKTIQDPSEKELARYQALKIYLMLGNPAYFSKEAVLHWFRQYWKLPSPRNTKQLFLLTNTLEHPLREVVLKENIIRETRNFLNALPPTYLYYALAKDSFSSKKLPLQAEGFTLPFQELPIYFTKEGFTKVLAFLPLTTAQLQKENWVLERQDLSNLFSLLKKAYIQDYVSWWKHFYKETHPKRYQDYESGKALTLALVQKETLLYLVHLMQQNTSPEIENPRSLFNRNIAHQFTSINLLSHSALVDLNTEIRELHKFLTTVSLVKDEGKTEYTLTRARFLGDNLSNPLQSLYQKAKQLPYPIDSWTKSIADDTWFLFLKESKSYINTLWKKEVYPLYKNTIANHYPLDPQEKEEVSIQDFNAFFSPKGTFNRFVKTYIKPFLDTTHAEWKPKILNGYKLPLSYTLVNELIRTNVISKMFFPDQATQSKIVFSLQKVTLDPVIASLQLTIGSTTLKDNQGNDTETEFTWPQSGGASLRLRSIEGQNYTLEEKGVWAFFKILQKVNVLVDTNDSASLQILFEINGNSGRYVLKTENPINPFSPGILTGFTLPNSIT